MQPRRINPRARNQRSGIQPNHAKQQTHKHAQGSELPFLFGALLDKSPKTLLIRPLTGQMTFGDQLVGRFDPYCRFTVDGQTRETRAALNMGGTPQWSDLLEWTVSPTADEVILQVFDRNVGGSDVYVGRGSFRLQHEASEGKIENRIIVMELSKGLYEQVGSVTIIVDLQPSNQQAYGSQLPTEFQDSFLQESQNPRGLGYIIFNPGSNTSVNTSKVLELVAEERKKQSLIENSVVDYSTSSYPNILDQTQLANQSNNSNYTLPLPTHTASSYWPPVTHAQPAPTFYAQPQATGLSLRTQPHHYASYTVPTRF